MAERPFRQALEHRQDECRGLSGAGLRQAQQVAPFERDRNRLLLDRSRRIVPGRNDAGEYTWLEGELFEIQVGRLLGFTEPSCTLSPMLLHMSTVS